MNINNYFVNYFEFIVHNSYTSSMNEEKLLTTVVKAGKMLLESGAEIYRVEETMVRLCESYPEVQEADSFVTSTGIMMSIVVNGKTSTKVMRIYNRSVDLNVIDRVNSLSRKVCEHSISVDELESSLVEIEKEERYTYLTTLLFGAIGTAAFAIFFDGSFMDAIAAFFVGIFIRCVTIFFDEIGLNAFFTNVIASGIAVLFSYMLKVIFVQIDMHIVIIASIMLLVPGLAITNAIRDTVAGDYLAGLSRGTEACLIALAIALGAGFMLSVIV